MIRVNNQQEGLALRQVRGEHLPQAQQPVTTESGVARSSDVFSREARNLDC